MLRHIMIGACILLTVGAAHVSGQNYDQATAAAARPCGPGR